MIIIIYQLAYISIARITLHNIFKSLIKLIPRQMLGQEYLFYIQEYHIFEKCENVIFRENKIFR